MNKHGYLVLRHSLFSASALLHSVTALFLNVVGTFSASALLLSTVLYRTFGYPLYCVPLIHCYWSMQENIYMISILTMKHKKTKVISSDAKA